eukprot:13970950-Alexandrium_andersonii.AAC.1
MLRYAALQQHESARKWVAQAASARTRKDSARGSKVSRTTFCTDGAPTGPAGTVPKWAPLWEGPTPNPVDHAAEA